MKSKTSSSSLSLKEIFDKHHCDKSSRHSYHDVYGPLLEKYRGKKSFKLLEVGILRGESLASWVEYFPDAKMICGIDTFDRVRNPSEISILNGDAPNVKYFKGDSMEIALPKNIGLFDVIIDDGLHTPLANGKTFSNLSKYLKKDGIYIIEDVWPLDVMTANELSHPWLHRKGNKGKYTMDNYRYFLSCLDGYDVQRHDMRHISGNPDSYIFAITEQREKKKGSGN